MAMSMVSEGAFGATIGAISNSRPVDLIEKMERDIQKALKKLKQTQRDHQILQEQQNQLKSNAENSEMLDLKSELYSLKNKLVLQD